MGRQVTVAVANDSYLFCIKIFNLYIFVIYFDIVMSLTLGEFCCYDSCVFCHKTMIIFAKQYMEFIFDW